MSRTIRPDGILIEPDENYIINTMTAEECIYWNIPVLWAGKKLNFIRYQTILFNLNRSRGHSRDA